MEGMEVGDDLEYSDDTMHTSCNDLCAVGDGKSFGCCDVCYGSVLYEPCKHIRCSQGSKGVHPSSGGPCSCHPSSTGF